MQVDPVLLEIRRVRVVAINSIAFTRTRVGEASVAIFFACGYGRNDVAATACGVLAMKRVLPNYLVPGFLVSVASWESAATSFVAIS